MRDTNLIILSIALFSSITFLAISSSQIQIKKELTKEIRTYKDSVLTNENLRLKEKNKMLILINLEKSKKRPDKKYLDSLEVAYDLY